MKNFKGNTKYASILIVISHTLRNTQKTL